MELSLYGLCQSAHFTDLIQLVARLDSFHSKAHKKKPSFPTLGVGVNILPRTFDFRKSLKGPITLQKSNSEAKKSYDDDADPEEGGYFQ